MLLSLGIALVGLVPVLYLVGLVAWQFNAGIAGGSWVALPAALMFADHALLQGAKVAPVLPYIPQLPTDLAWTTQEAAAWVLSRLHVGLVPALIGCVIVAVGISSVLRQRALIHAHKERKKDRVRRIEDYRREASRAQEVERLEPFIGTEIVARHTDRRVA